MSPIPDDECWEYRTHWADAIRRFWRDRQPPMNRFYEEAASDPERVRRLLSGLRDRPGALSVMALTLFGRLLSHRPELATFCPSEVAEVCTNLEQRYPEELVVRLLLRAALTAEAEERPNVAQSAREELARHRDSPSFGAGWPPDRPAAWLEAAGHSRREGKHYRILFPTVREDPADDERGQLVWAEITVCPPLDTNPASGPRLVLAPWTFFRPSSESDEQNKKVAWLTLCEDFPRAMSKVGQSARQDYLLSLQPYAPEDMPTGGLLERLGWSTALAPEAVEIGGPSLGVAVALAALAAATDRRIRPVVATGMIDFEGKVIGVSDIKQKLRAWAGAWADLAGAPLFLYPWQNRSQELAKTAVTLGLSTPADQEHFLCHLQSLEDLKPKPEERDFFTDGFGGYRSRLEQWLQKQPPSPTREGETAEVFLPVASIVAALSPSEQHAQPPEAGLHQLIAWFDEEPCELADDVFRPLAKNWDDVRKPHTGWDYKSPVAVCVRVDSLLDEQGGAG